MKPEQERLRTVLADTVNLLCKSGLQFGRELRVQALVGITVDDEEVFIVHINESHHAGGGGSGPAGSATPKGSGVGASRPSVAKSPAQGSRSPAVGLGASQSGASNMSMALVPFSSPQQPRPGGTPMRRTPQSFGRKMRGGAGGLASMSPAAKQAAMKAKQKLQFPSGSLRGGASPRGMMKSPRGGMPPGSSPRGGGSGVGMSPRGGSTGGLSSPRGGGAPRMSGSADFSPNGRGAHSGSGTPRGRGAHSGPGASPRGRGSFQSASSSTPGMTSSRPSSTAGTAHQSEQQQFKQSPQQPRPQSTAGYMSQQNAAYNSTGQDYASPHSTVNDMPQLHRVSSQQPPPAKRIKVEKPDNSDIIDLDDEAAEFTVEGDSVDPTSGAVAMIPPGMVQQTQITRLTITTNAQGHPVRQYERVQSATVPTNVGGLGMGGIKTEVSGGGTGMVEEHYQSQDFLPDIDPSSASFSANQYASAAPTQDPYGYQSGTYQQDGYHGDGYQGAYMDSMAGDGYGTDCKMQGGVAGDGSGMNMSGWGAQGMSQQTNWMGDMDGGMMNQSDMKPDYSGLMGGGKMQSGGHFAHHGVSSATSDGTTPTKPTRGRGASATRAPRGPRGRGSRGGGEGGGGGGGRRPNAESFSEVKGAGGAEAGGTWKMVARFVCSIPGCDQSFSNKSNLLRHQNQKHGREAGGGSNSGGGGSMDGGDNNGEDEEFDDYY